MCVVHFIVCTIIFVAQKLEEQRRASEKRDTVEQRKREEQERREREVRFSTTQYHMTCNIIVTELYIHMYTHTLICCYTSSL